MFDTTVEDLQATVKQGQSLLREGRVKSFGKWVYNGLDDNKVIRFMRDKSERGLSSIYKKAANISNNPQNPEEKAALNLIESHTKELVDNLTSPIMLPGYVLGHDTPLAYAALASYIGLDAYSSIRKAKETKAGKRQMLQLEHIMMHKAFAASLSFVMLTQGLEALEAFQVMMQDFSDSDWASFFIDDAIEVSMHAATMIGAGWTLKNKVQQPPENYERYYPENYEAISLNA